MHVIRSDSLILRAEISENRCVNFLEFAPGLSQVAVIDDGRG